MSLDPKNHQLPAPALGQTSDVEFDQLCGDPASVRNQGVASGPDMTKSAWRHPLVLWRDRLLTLDCYWVPGQPMWLHVFCPLCEARHGQNLNEAIKVSQDKKPFHLEATQMPSRVARQLGLTYQQLAMKLGLQHVDQLQGVLTIENPIKCTWEAEPELRRSHGLAICPWRVVIENNIARDV